MAKARRKRAAQVARKLSRRRPTRTTTTTTTTTRRVVNPRYKAGPLTFYRRADAVAWGKPRGYTARAVPSKKRPRPRRRRNSEGNWPHSRPPGWSAERVAEWRRGSEAALHRQWKLQEAIGRRRSVYLKRHGRPGPGEMPEELAVRHAAYRRAQTAKIRRLVREERAEARERRKAKRGNPMAKRKRSAAQRRAFRKMLAGLKRHKARKNPGRKRRGRARRRKNPVSVATNPRRKRRKNSRGGSIMAKRRRRTRTNPGRRHHRRRNPHRRYRRRNPGGGGVVSIVKSTIAAAIPSMAAGGVLALVDAKLFQDKAMPVQVIGKLGLAGAAGYFLRSRPRTACLVMGAIMGGIGYQLAAQAAGGVVAPDKATAGKKMAALVYANRGMAALVNSNGTLRTQPTLSGMGQGMGDGGTALPTMPIYDPVNLG